MIFNKSKKAIKIVLSTVLIMALLASLSLSNLSAAAETTTLLKATDDHSVVSDVATNPNEWKARENTTVSKDDDDSCVKFEFKDKTSINNNIVYVNTSESDYTLNQRVKAEYVFPDLNSKDYTLENSVLVTLFSRFRMENGKALGYVAQLKTGYDSNSKVSYTYVEIYKWTYVNNVWKANVKLGRIAIPSQSVFESSKTVALEMVVTGTDSTNITVNLYKNSNLAANTTVIDNDEYLQQKGTVAVSGLNYGGSSYASILQLSDFEYTSTDEVYGNNLFGYWANINKIYQRLPVEPGKTYIIDALVSKTDGSYSYPDNPFLVSIITGRSSLKDTTQQVIETTVNSSIKDEFTHVTYEFTVPSDLVASSDNSYMQKDDFTNYYLMCDIGLNLTSGSGCYSNLTVYYSKDDTEKNNLFVNGDFKMGRYGWIYDNNEIKNSEDFCFYASEGIRLPEGKLIGEVEGSKSNVKAIENDGSNYNNFKFYSKFKNTDLPQGDANCDKEVNICDLVETDDIITKGDYIGTVDMDKNSAINTDDFNTLRTNLLNS